MKAIVGSIVSVVLSFACLAAVAMLGMQSDSFLLLIGVVMVAVVTSNVVVRVAFPTDFRWLYPLCFSLPMILIGAQAILNKSPATILELGFFALVVGGSVAYAPEMHFRSKKNDD